MPRCTPLVLALLLLAGCGGGGHTLTGVVQALGPSCPAAHVAHVTVTVRGATGSVIGTTATGDFVPGGTCSATYRLKLPDSAFYQFTIGAIPGPSYTRADLAARKWAPVIDVP